VPTGGLNGNISHAHKIRSNITHFKLSAPAWEGRLTLGFLTISVYFLCNNTLEGGKTGSGAAKVAAAPTTTDELYR
jgi:hypothetical protein